MRNVARRAATVAAMLGLAGCAALGPDADRGEGRSASAPIGISAPPAIAAPRPAADGAPAASSPMPAAADATRAPAPAATGQDLPVTPSGPDRMPAAAQKPPTEEELAALFGIEIDDDGRFIGGTASKRIASLHPDLWARLRAGFAMAELKTPLVRDKERFYAADAQQLVRLLERGAPYLHFIVEEVEKRGMPLELALLPFVESAMNPVALSHAKAAGLWQFIPATGRRYELSQDWWVDERRDVVRSTRAALEYLKTICDMHGGDWFLALASYNWGENAVARAVRANRAAGRPAGYLNLRMPKETRHYVPKLIALKNIVMRPTDFGVTLPAVPDAPYFASITKTRPIDLKLAASFAGMTMEEFVALNPAHNRPVIAATRENRIRLPANRLEDFAKALERHVRSNQPLASWQPYTLKKGETLEEVARRAGVPMAELLGANGLDGRGRVLAGSRLLVPQRDVVDESSIRSFAGPHVYQQLSVPAAYHFVRPGETMAAVARRYRVALPDLRRWNGEIASAGVGTRLLVRPAATRTVVTTPTSTAMTAVQPAVAKRVGSRQIVSTARRKAQNPAAPTRARPATTSSPKTVPAKTAPAKSAPAKPSRQKEPVRVTT